jgi:hypothetical protein
MTALMDVSPYTGSEATKKMVEAQIRARWGEAAVEEYDPYTNCMTYRAWVVKRQMRVKKGERALKSITLCEAKDKKTGVTRKFSRPVFLFFHRQVEPIS